MIPVKSLANCLKPGIFREPVGDHFGYSESFGRGVASGERVGRKDFASPVLIRLASVVARDSESFEFAKNG